MLPLTLAARAPKLPADAPTCASPGTRPIFVSPAGEPFRAESGQPYPSAVWIRQADRNGDGAIDRAELLADGDAFFARLDRDHDGRLTPDEVSLYEAQVAPETSLYSDRPVYERRRRSSDRESADYGRPMGAGRYAWLNLPEPVAAADVDYDRVITREEFDAALGRRFDTLAQGKAGLALGMLARTPQQASIEGPCRPTKARKGRDPDRD